MIRSVKKRLDQICIHHLRSFAFACGEMRRQPLAFIFTVLVIAIAFALPFGLYRLLNNIQPIGTQLNTHPNIAVYTSNRLSTKEITALQTQIRNLPGVAQVSYTNPQQGLKAFSQYAKLGNILQSLKSNPLPGMITVIPSLSTQTPQQLQVLVNRLRALPNTDLIQLNMTWVKRLYYLINFVQRIVFALAALFAIGVFLIVGNTIRLITQRQKEDINIMRLFGAQPGFIRRPLLYHGILIGLLGGLIAWLTVTLVLWWLAIPLESFAHTYQSNIVIEGLSFQGGFEMMLGGMGLAGLAAWFAIQPHLHAKENE